MKWRSFSGVAPRTLSLSAAILFFLESSPAGKLDNPIRTLIFWCWSTPRVLLVAALSWLGHTDSELNSNCRFWRSLRCQEENTWLGFASNLKLAQGFSFEALSLHILIHGHDLAM